MNNYGYSLQKIVITPRISITLYKGHLPIAWGHLDPGQGKTWLGIAVAQGYTKKGNGSKIVRALCKYADKAGWDLWLTCKPELKTWYKSFGFKVMFIKKVVFMKRKKKEEGKNAR